MGFTPEKSINWTQKDHGPPQIHPFFFSVSPKQRFSDLLL